mmetsp:Transcript_22676/g.58340  ORF Transcript_22676/g.58340 Transcript_22676/m.58340 type:complete len:258 (-) Transcript_22676:312-1085(-)
MRSEQSVPQKPSSHAHTEPMHLPRPLHRLWHVPGERSGSVHLAPHQVGSHTHTCSPFGSKCASGISRTTPGGSSQRGSLGMRIPCPLHALAAREASARSCSSCSIAGESTTVIVQRSSEAPVCQRLLRYRPGSSGGRCSKHMRRMRRLASSHCAAHSHVIGNVASGRPHGALAIVKPHMDAQAGNIGSEHRSPRRCGGHEHSPVARLHVPFGAHVCGQSFSNERTDAADVLTVGTGAAELCCGDIAARAGAARDGCS